MNQSNFIIFFKNKPKFKHLDILNHLKENNILNVNVSLTRKESKDEIQITSQNTIPASVIDSMYTGETTIFALYNEDNVESICCFSFSEERQQNLKGFYIVNSVSPYLEINNKKENMNHVIYSFLQEIPTKLKETFQKIENPSFDFDTKIYG